MVSSNSGLPAFIVSGSIQSKFPFLKEFVVVIRRLKEEQVLVSGYPDDKGFFVFQLPASESGQPVEVFAHHPLFALHSEAVVVELKKKGTFTVHLTLEVLDDQAHQKQPGKTAWPYLSVRPETLQLFQELSIEQGLKGKAPAPVVSAIEAMEEIVQAAQIFLKGKMPKNKFAQLLEELNKKYSKVENNPIRTKKRNTRPPGFEPRFLFHLDEVFSVLAAGFQLDMLSEGRKISFVVLANQLISSLGIPSERYFQEIQFHGCGLSAAPEFGRIPGRGLPGVGQPAYGLEDLPGRDLGFQGASQLGIPCRDPDWQPMDPGEFLGGHFWKDCSDALSTDLDKLAKARMYRGPDTHIIDYPAPNLLCYNYRTLLIKLTPVEGQDFSGVGAEVSVCFANGMEAEREIELEKQFSADQEIRVLFPSGLHTGFIYFKWGIGANISGFSRACAKLSRFTNPFLNPVMRRSFPTLTERNVVEIVQMPVIHQFGDRPGSENMLAEGCTSVVIACEVNFGDTEFREADELSLNKIRLFIYRLDTAAGEGQQLIATIDSWNYAFVEVQTYNKWYRLIAETIVRGEVCSRAEARLVIERYQAIHLSFDEPEIMVGSTRLLRVQRSCPLPEAAVVTLFCSDPEALVVPAMAEIPAGQNFVEMEVMAIGSACTTVEVSCHAEGYVTNLDDSRASLTVYDYPKIFSIEGDLRDCQPLRLTIRGNCFTPINQIYILQGSSNIVMLEARSGDLSSIEVSLPPLDKGRYVVRLRNSRGLWSNDITIEVVGTPSEILSFAVGPDDYDPCSGLLYISLRVKAATAIKVYEDDEVIMDITYEACGIHQEELARHPNKAHTYRLIVSGPTSSAEASIRPVFGVRIVSSLRITNQKSSERIFWAFQEGMGNVVTTTRVRVAGGAEGTLSLTGVECIYYNLLVAIDPSEMTANGMDYGEARVINNWESFTTGDPAGLPMKARAAGEVISFTYTSAGDFILDS